MLNSTRTHNLRDIFDTGPPAMNCVRACCANCLVRKPLCPDTTVPMMLHLLHTNSIKRLCSASASLWSTQTLTTRRDRNSVRDMKALDRERWAKCVCCSSRPSCNNRVRDRQDHHRGFLSLNLRSIQSGYKYPFPSLVAVCKYIMLPGQLSPTNRGITWQIRLSVSKTTSVPGACVSFKS